MTTDISRSSFLEGSFERIVLLGDIWASPVGRRAVRWASSLPRAARTQRSLAASIVHLPIRARQPRHRGCRAGCTGRAERVGRRGPPALHARPPERPGGEPRAWLSELGVWVGAWVRRFGFAAAYRLLRRLDSARGGASLYSRRCSFQRWAVNEARLRQADVVVTGHTHIATRAEHGERCS